MPLLNINPTTTKAWKKLAEHQEEIKDEHLRVLFAEDPQRAAKFAIEWQDFLVDYSKNRITDKTLQLLIELAEEVGLKDAIQKYYSGDIINQTEARAVLHTALRAKKDGTILVDGANVIPEVFQVKEKIRTFSNKIISGEAKGYTGKTFTDVVNIGIGGSDLGPLW